MRVIHIIPSAFDYFDDIRRHAFSILEKQIESGVEAEAFTLQYGSVTRGQKSAAKLDAPASRFIGLFGLNELVDSLSNFDVVHLHCPFLGAAKKIIDWRKKNPDRPLVITYHRDLDFSDLFSLFIIGYNYFYLPRLFAVATAVAGSSAEEFAQTKGRRYLKQPEKFTDISASAVDIEKEAGIHLTDTPDKLKLLSTDAEALAYIKLYKNLVI
ncbi:MAG: hypothetical protein PHD72_00085 [Patescibacteria group bacterium]|nr:hypothetical protein [Patescibacteria group bacterium]